MMSDQEANFRQIALHQAAHDHKGMSPAVKVVEDAKTYYAFLRADDAELLRARALTGKPQPSAPGTI